jgi:hypothetical protein
MGSHCGSFGRYLRRSNDDMSLEYRPEIRGSRRLCNQRDGDKIVMLHKVPYQEIYVSDIMQVPRLVWYCICS